MFVLKTIIFPLTHSGRLSKTSNKIEKFYKRPATCLHGSFREGGEWSPSSDSYPQGLRDLILPANQTKNECHSINLHKKHIFIYPKYRILTWVSQIIIWSLISMAILSSSWPGEFIFTTRISTSVRQHYSKLVDIDFQSPGRCLNGHYQYLSLPLWFLYLFWWTSYLIAVLSHITWSFAIWIHWIMNSVQIIGPYLQMATENMCEDKQKFLKKDPNHAPWTT